MKHAVPRAFPATRTDSVVDRFHGVEVRDPYRWLEDDDASEVKSWTAQQNAFLREALDGFPGRAWIDKRLRRLFASNTLSAPVPVRSHPGQPLRLFHLRRSDGADQPALCVREGCDGPTRVLVDPNALSGDGRIALDWWYPSRNGAWVAYGLSEGGDEMSTLQVIEVATGRVLSDRIPRTKACSLAWLSSGEGFYYTRFPTPGSVPSGEEHYHRHVFLHLLGTDAKEDAKIYGRGIGWSAWPMVALSPDDRFLIVEVLDGSLRTDVYLLDTKDASFPRPVPVAEGRSAIFTVVEVTTSRVYVVTNEDAPRWRLMAFDPHRPEEWMVVLPECEEILESVAITSDNIVALYKKDAASALRVHSLDGATRIEVPLPCPGTVSELVGHPEHGEVFLNFASFLVPNLVYRLDPQSGRTSTFSEVVLPVDPSTFTVQQVRYSSRDGTSVPMFLVHRKGLVLDGTNPTLLYGYGGFNVPVLPWFFPMALPFMESGGVFAVAVLRGGGEFGEDWHLAGVLDKKQNVFDDFIAAAEYLIAAKVTSRERLAISGRSNGGLLIAAVLTQRPDLFQAAVSGVPLTDMLRYHLFGVARLWAPEYGCADNPEHFPWLYAYSPYHRVREGSRYPAALFFTSETDGRVVPMHARKMVARLQAASPEPRPIYVRTESAGGHGQSKPTSQLIEQHLDELTFLFKNLGMVPPVEPVG
jgi:prolyl oligopeptidase